MAVSPKPVAAKTAMAACPKRVATKTAMAPCPKPVATKIAMVPCTKPIATKTAIRRIHAAIRAVPAGSVAGYGVIAHRAGLPGRARLVARVLSNNADPTLPWHRVLRSDGRIAFPPDADGYAEQVQRLRAEGVTVEAGRVRGMPRAGASLDALLWAPPRR